MDSNTNNRQSPDRIGQVLTGSAVLQAPADSALQGADSNPAPLDQHAQTLVSAAEMVVESHRYSSVTSEGEGVASAGNPAAAAGGYEGETSGHNGMHQDFQAGGGSTGYIEAGAASPMDYQAEAEGSPSLIGSGGKRKNQASDSNLESKRAEHQGDGMMQRVGSDPASELAMVTGDSEDYPMPALEGACDSNGAGGSVDNVPAAGGDSRPTDQEIIDFENKIKEGVLSVALIGDVQPLNTLEAEYAAGSEVFRAKIASLRSSYASIRHTRGDGNCFFRSFAFGYLENLLLTNDLKERDRVLARLEQLKSDLTKFGYDELVVESPLEILIGMLRSIGSLIDPLTVQVLEINMREENVSSYIVFLLRMITSAEVKSREDFFAPFIIGLSGLDVDTFCSRCIDPMGEESDHVQLVALTDAFKVPIRVVYLDRSQGGAPEGGGGTHVDMHDFIPDGCEQQPRVHLLYRPGHYDVLYPIQN